MKRLIFIIAVGLLFVFNSCVNENNLNNHTIAVLLPTENSNPIDGVALNAAAEVAITVLNEHSESEFQLKVFDTGYKYEKIDAAIDSIVSDEIDIVVSALTSSNLRVLADKINESGLLWIDVTSTLSELAVDDNIFRFIPDDRTTAIAINNLLKQENFSQLAMNYRDDVWGSGLSTELKNLYEGSIIADERYDARLPVLDIPDNVLALNEAVTLAIGNTNNDNIAVELFSFEEAIEVFVEADQYPNLKLVKWFGSDGLVNNAELLQNEVAASFAEKVGIYSPVISRLETTQYQFVSDQVRLKTGYAPYAIAMLMYDAVWAAGNVLDELVLVENENAKEVLLDILSDIDFVTGDIELNSNGDRVSCSYDFMGVRKVNAAYEWYKAF